MKVLFAVHAYKPAYRVGGPVYSVSALAEGLVSRGHAVAVFTTNSNLDQDLDVPTDQPVDVDGVEVWYFRRTALLKSLLPFAPYFAKSLGFLYAPRMARELERLAPQVDLVHTHMPFNYPCLAAARAAFRHDKPLFYHQRGVLDPERLKFRALKKWAYVELIEKPIMRKATSLIALTDAEENSYRRLGIRTPCHIVPNGINVQADQNWDAVLAGLGIPDGVPLILFMGRIHPIKGADLLLEAFSLLCRKIPDAMLVLAGPDEFGLEKRYQQTASDHALSKRVIFPGMVSGELKAALLARANLFCLPSVAEGFSIAILEALGHGVPVLISPGCHFPEVEQANVGRVTERTPTAIAEAAEDMLRNPAKLRSMGSAARDFVRRTYDWSTIVDRMIEVYEEGIARHRDRRPDAG